MVNVKASASNGKRRRARSDFTDDATSVPFFDEAKVPLLSIEVPNPEVQDLSPDQYEVVGQKVSHRLAQRPGAYVVLKYVRQVIKRRDTETLHCAPAPAGVIEGKRLHRLEHAKPLVEQFFAWVDEQLARQGLLPSNALTKALAYAICARTPHGADGVPGRRGRADGHEPSGARAAADPMGRRNWLFCWTEVGARHAGIVQSLIATCRLHGIDATTST